MAAYNQHSFRCLLSGNGHAVEGHVGQDGHAVDDLLGGDGPKAIEHIGHIAGDHGLGEGGADLPILDEEAVLGHAGEVAVAGGRAAGEPADRASG